MDLTENNVVNFFRGQVFFKKEDTKYKYMMKHNMIKLQLFIKRVDWARENEDGILPDIERNFEDYRSKDNKCTKLMQS
jgi:hypothetical protein